MCTVCDLARKEPLDRALKRIESAIQHGPLGHEHYKEVLDELLGTKEPEQDQEMDQAWEDEHRDR